MAKTEEDLDLDVAKQETPVKKGGMKKIIIIAVAAVVLVSGIGGGAWFFLNKSADADSADAASETKSAAAGKHGGKSDKKDVKSKKEKKDAHALPAVYLALDPAFVVNFEDQGVVRFLQITAEVGTHDPLALDAVRLRLDEERAPQRIGRVDHARLVRQHLLRAQCDGHRFLARQRQRLVHRVRVQALCPAENRRERLQRRPHDVVLGLLRR